MSPDILVCGVGALWEPSVEVKQSPQLGLKQSLLNLPSPNSQVSCLALTLVITSPAQFAPQPDLTSSPSSSAEQLQEPEGQGAAGPVGSPAVRPSLLQGQQVFCNLAEGMWRGQGPFLILEKNSPPTSWPPTSHLLLSICPQLPKPASPWSHCLQRAPWVCQVKAKLFSQLGNRITCYLA